jgi:hypothetical protein
MRRIRAAGCCGLVAAFLAAAGCADGSKTGEVNGEVTLDGKLLDEGVVRFVPVDGKTTTASALIANGKFTEKVPVGKHRVEISAPKMPKGFNSSKEIKRGTIDEGQALEELIPVRYNSQSKLEAEVKAGRNDLKYDLTSGRN